MCGRYYIQLDESEIATKIKKRLRQLEISDFMEGEIFPSQKAIVFVPKKNGIDIDVKVWGIQKKSLIINARSETAHEKLTFKRILKNRCAIIANGFYEWNRNKKIFITRKDESMIYFAGLFNEKNEFVILTGESEKDMKKIHARTPLFMTYEEMLDYLNFKTDVKVNNDHLFFELCEDDVFNC